MRKLENMVRTNYYFPREMLEDLKELAAKSDRTVVGIIREAIKEKIYAAPNARAN